MLDGELITVTYSQALGTDTAPHELHRADLTSLGNCCETMLFDDLY